MDAAFIFNSMIEQCTLLKNTLFCCYVDLRHAFDSVPHQLLWNKLLSLGCGGKLLTIKSDVHSSCC